MSEPKEPYITQDETVVLGPFTASVKHASMLRDLIERGVGRSKSEVFRVALEKLFYATPSIDESKIFDE